MVLYCKGIGTDRLSNKYWFFRACWAQLYHREYSQCVYSAPIAATPFSFALLQT